MDYYNLAVEMQYNGFQELAEDYALIAIKELISKGIVSKGMIKTQILGEISHEN